MKRTKVNGVIIYEYDEFNIVRTGTKDYPWNIYKNDGVGFGEWVSCGKTIKECANIIEVGIF